MTNYYGQPPGNQQPDGFGNYPQNNIPSPNQPPQNNFTPYMPPPQPPIYYAPPIDYGAPIRSTSNKIGVSLILTDIVAYMVFILLAIFTSATFREGLADRTSFSGQLFTGITYLLMFVIPMIICQKLLRIPNKIAYPFRKPSPDVLFGSIGISMGVTVFGGIVVAVLYAIIAATTGYGPVYPLDYVPRGFEANVLFFINIAIIPPFVEELFFRGVIMQSLRLYGDKFALIVSSLLFGLAHGNLIQAPNAFILGLVLGYFTLYSGSLWPAIAMHFVNNGVSVVLTWLTLDTTTDQDNYIGTLYLLIRICVGLLSFAFLTYRKGKLFKIPPSNYPLPEGKKYKNFMVAAAMIIYLIIIVILTIANMEPVGEDFLYKQ